MDALVTEILNSFRTFSLKFENNITFTRRKVHGKQLNCVTLKAY